MQTLKLLRQMRDQDSEPAFRALFDQHYPRMFRIAYYYLQDDDLAQEVTLDVLAELWIKRKTLVIPDTDPDSELFETYERLLSELPPRCREVFCRIKEDEQSYAEVAEAMGISVKTVDAQLQKALRSLRKGMSKYLGHEDGKRFFLLFL